MFMFLRIERPTTATLRPFAIATSAACWTRCMFDANEATMIRPVRSGISWRNASPTSRSEPVMPGSLGVRRVAEQQVDAPVAELGERPDVGLQPVDRRVVELPVARVQDATCRRLDHDRHRVGDRVRHADELEPERPELHGPGSRVRLAQRRRRAEPVLVELRLDEPEREPRADHLPHLDLAQDVGQAADVVLVRVGEDDRPDGASRAGRRSPAARGRRRGARRAGRRDRRRRRSARRRARRRHVLPDLAEPAERDDAERLAHERSLCSLRAATGFAPHPRVGQASDGFEQAKALEAAANARRFVVVASTSGSRRPPTSWPSRWSARLIAIGLSARGGSRSRARAPRRARVPRRRHLRVQRHQLLHPGPTTCV